MESLQEDDRDRCGDQERIDPLQMRNGLPFDLLMNGCGPFLGIEFSGSSPYQYFLDFAHASNGHSLFALLPGHVLQ